MYLLFTAHPCPRHPCPRHLCQHALLYLLATDQHKTDSNNHRPEPWQGLWIILGKLLAGGGSEWGLGTWTELITRFSLLTTPACLPCSSLYLNPHCVPPDTCADRPDCSLLPPVLRRDKPPPPNRGISRNRRKKQPFSWKAGKNLIREIQKNSSSFSAMLYQRK